ncbi:MAG: phosphoribosylformylglycinamidine synthase [Oscillospiraceae bacterium]|nr:phosphoribosylformylglycinamidine synthase [Oscillospiraceae bacterium]
MAVTRFFAEKKPGFDVEAVHLLAHLRQVVGAQGLRRVRIFQRYDVEGATPQALAQARRIIFSEPNADALYVDVLPPLPGRVFAVALLPGQYDQRADSAAQCLQLLTQQERPAVACAKVYALDGDVDEAQFAAIRAEMINPVEAGEVSLAKPDTLAMPFDPPPPVPVLAGFITQNEQGLAAVAEEMGLAMTVEDLVFCQAYFRGEARREPTLTEIRAIDTYWSDHCRHTTFQTELTGVDVAPGLLAEPIAEAWARYQRARGATEQTEKPVTLMDMATLGMRLLRAAGKLEDLDASEEINACSIQIEAAVDGKPEPWLVMFKNETHNHPTEIEGFGGAATCLGGAIRDPLAGRAYVYQAMRISGSGDPRAPVAETRPGKLPQRRITTAAAQGFSSYGNQIGLAAGKVQEVYHPGFVAKRLELGAVIAATPADHVRRQRPAPGDVVLLLGGRTGRDGCGGATGSSKAHDSTSLTTCGAQVQKGNPPTERCLQRLFSNPDFARKIKRCNDFGAGGVCVAVGELAPGLTIDLDAVPRKYEGLDGTELAISESQERMACVAAPEDVAVLAALALAENLEATPVAVVTVEPVLRMTWRGQDVVTIDRAFLDTNGVRQRARAAIPAPDEKNPYPLRLPAPLSESASLAWNWLTLMGDLNVCSQKGLVERFDATIGAGTVIAPYGGSHRLTPNQAMVALLPASGRTATATWMAHGFDPYLASWSPYHGAAWAVVEALAKVTAAGGDAAACRLTLQEYFPRACDGESWGAPTAALLGALDAQLGMETPAIGGKDSMSGTFEELRVPPTLVAFAVAAGAVDQVITPELKGHGHTLALYSAPRTPALSPDYAAVRAGYAAIRALMASGRVLAAYALGHGGLAAALTHMALGNQVGVALTETCPKQLFLPQWGSLVLELSAGDMPPFLVSVGQTIEEPAIRWPGGRLSLAEVGRAWAAPLEDVFPTRAEGSAQPPPYAPWAKRPAPRPHASIAKPQVCIPCFPGTNCELDSARAFRRAGADARIIRFRNVNPAALEESVAALVRAIDQAQIVMLPGGFSAGDEPEGSGKFIATALRNPKVAEALHRLLVARDGLMLGICNGFQALIKLGLLPYGEIRVLGESDPTLTFNSLGRHVATHVHTVVSSVKSPWLASAEAGSVYAMAVSHGEGRFVCGDAQLHRLLANGQIVTQYCTPDGVPAASLPHNPNGSVWAVEGLCSPDGRILGKMGHSERIGPGVARNIPGAQDQGIFEAGVRYFR